MLSYIRLLLVFRSSLSAAPSVLLRLPYFLLQLLVFFLEQLQLSLQFMNHLIHLLFLFVNGFLVIDKPRVTTS